MDTTNPVEGAHGLTASEKAAGRVKWHTAAALVAILPAAGAGYTAKAVLNVFHGIALTGSLGAGTVAAGLAEANRLMVPAAMAGAAIALGLCIVLFRKPERAEVFPAFFFSLGIALLACLPALLLWAAESLTIEVLANRVQGTVAEASQSLGALLLGAMGSAVLVIPFVVVAAAISMRLSRTRPVAPALRLAVAWAIATLLLLGIGTAYYSRSTYLHKAALEGHL